MSPLTISAVIPVFNKAPHVGAAIASALAQGRPPDEIVVIDDASRDGSRAVIESFTDERIRLLSRPVPGPGGYAARNLAIREARSQWIAFLDADDVWYPGHLATLTRMASTAGSEVVGAFTGWERVWPDGRRQRDVFGASLGPGVAETVLDFDRFLAVWGALGTSPIWTTASAFRREALLQAGLFPEGRCRRGGDADLWLRIMALGSALASTEVSAAYHQDTVNQVTRLERGAGSHCAWATLEMLAADAPESRRRLLADLKDVLTNADFRLRAAMERYAPVTGRSASPGVRWLRRLVLETLVRLPRPVQVRARAIQRRLTRRRRMTGS